MHRRRCLGKRDGIYHVCAPGNLSGKHADEHVTCAMAGDYIDQMAGVVAPLIRNTIRAGGCEHIRNWPPSA